MVPISITIPPTLILTLITSMAFVACEAESDISARFDDVEAVAQLQGVDTGKFDRVNTIATWQLKEDDQYSMIEGINDLGERKFAAIMPIETQATEARVELIGANRCEIQVNLATMALANTTCDESALKGFEVPAIQLLSTLAPTFDEEQIASMKADGLFTKIACVGAGIGATLISAIVWQFASGVAAAGASVSTTVPVLAAGSSVLGAVALCYQAFFSGGEVSGCVSECHGELGCVESCIGEARRSLDELEGVERAQVAASQLLQCVGECGDEEGCEPLCYELLSSSY